MMLNTSEVLDLSKENVQPLRQGRKAAHLKTALQAQTDPEMQYRLQKQREEYEFAIRMYEGDDPLQPYWEYAAWLEQSFTKLGRESNLIPLLEDALLKFKDCDKYRQDPRFVQLLIKYINAQSNPLELYQMSYSQGLGTMCSALYRAWAEELDKNNDFKRADQIYQLGIQCRAQPLEELQNAHVQFQLSIARKMLEGNINNAEQNAENSRSALSKLQPSKVKSTRTSKDTAGIFQVANRDSKCNAMASGKFKVYQEDEPDGIMKSDFKNKSEKFTRGSVAERENIMKAGKWVGQKQKQSGVFKSAMPTTPSFQIHEDPDAACDNVKTVLRPRALKMRREEFKCPVAVFEDPDPTKKPMYPKHLVYVGGRDMQLEELRAAMYWKRIEKQEQEKKLHEEIVLMETPNKSPPDQSNAEVEAKSEKSHSSSEPNQNITPRNANIPSLQKFPVDQSNKEMESKTELRSISDTIEKNDQIKYSPANLICKKPEMKTEQSHSIHETSQRNVSAEVDPLVGLFEKGGPIPHYSPSTSFTVNTRAAMNVIQTMWASPLPPSNAKCQKTNNDFDDSMFKVPSRTPPCSRQAQKKLTFPVFCDDDTKSQFPVFCDEAPVALTQKLPTSQISSVNKLSFPDFTNEMLATSTQNPESCKVTPSNKLSFPIYSDENIAPSMQKSNNSKMTNDKLSFPVFSDEVLATSTQQSDSKPTGKLPFPIYTDEPLIPLQKPESSKNPTPSMFSFPIDIDEGISPLVGLKSNRNRNQFSEVDKLLFPIDKDDEVAMPKKTELATPVQAEIRSIPLIVPVNLADTPLQPENKENLPPKSYATPIERRPLSGILTPACNVPVKPIEDEDSEDDEEYCKMIPKTNDFDDETCSTKAFAIALPSSTPFVRSRRSSPRKSLLYNGSYISEESTAKSTTEGSKHIDGQHLSLILENSKEHGSNSSGGSSAVNK